MYKKIVKKIEEFNIGKYLLNEEISKHTTYKVGGLARLIVYPSNVDNLIKLLTILKENDLKYRILGSGSNTLFSDKVYDDILIKLDSLNDLVIDKTTVIVGGGYNLAKLSNKVSKIGLSGLEFACGIPGTVGASVCMNAGAFGSNMQRIVKEVKVITPELKIETRKNEDLKFDYRTSVLKREKKDICIEVTLQLENKDKEEINKFIKEIIKKRKESQPIEYPSAGSVFRNPENNFAAGKLIEDLGLKGYSIEGAEVSQKHANFIINKNQASASNIKDLIFHVKNKVKEVHDVDLEIEQELINF